MTETDLDALSSVIPKLQEIVNVVRPIADKDAAVIDRYRDNPPATEEEKVLVGAAVGVAAAAEVLGKALEFLKLLVATY